MDKSFILEAFVDSQVYLFSSFRVRQIFSANFETEFARYKINRVI